ncbi:MAG TPA: hypothetical protein VKM35_01130, partial [Arenimonas sp.]|uniref:hypothetical protein n=1 Tax=Arenimonas sp. TaxID=1872635 RepID=UPI002BC75824
SEEGTAAAYVENSSGESMVKMCTLVDKKCYWGVFLDSPCVDGEKYNGMLTTDAATLVVHLVCVGNKKDKQKLLAFSEYSEVAQLVSASKRASLAIAVEDVRFHVMEFSLNGAAQAGLAAELKVSQAAEEKKH